MANAGPPGPAKKRRESDCCSVGFLKNVMHIYNVVFIIAGLIVLGVGVWSVVAKHQFVALLATSTYALTAYTLLLAGGLVVVAGVAGCVALCQENRCLLLVYIFTLLLIFLLEAMVGILAYIYEGHVQNELSVSLNETFTDGYQINPEVTKAIDQLQLEFKCCGAVRFEDWKFSRWLKENPSVKNLVPDSCCISRIENCGVRDHPSNIYYNGCIYRLANEMSEHLNILGGVGLGFSVVQIFGLVLACSLYIRLKDPPRQSQTNNTGTTSRT
ncbi:CD151 antigen-like [Neocloeon triangulifer]|uniref:CD151 antigen-like n=1 Tax=Neocloeon triangulifer TaxID=2078957 RepID=UPI00286ED57C|nr:CD151 antigen-like [Neocloeon triangulifer]